MRIRNTRTLPIGSPSSWACWGSSTLIVTVRPCQYLDYPMTMAVSQHSRGHRQPAEVHRAVDCATAVDSTPSSDDKATPSSPLTSLGLNGIRCAPLNARRQKP